MSNCTVCGKAIRPTLWMYSLMFCKRKMFHFDELPVEYCSYRHYQLAWCSILQLTSNVARQTNSTVTINIEQFSVGCSVCHVM